MAEHICPSCHCSFKQEFLCTTCGAEKLKDESYRQLERALHSKTEALMMQTNEIERLRKFHHDQQELHEMNEAVQQTNRLLREQLAKFERADEEHDRIARDAANARRQLAECKRESETLARQYHSMKCSREDLHYKLATVTKARDNWKRKAELPMKYKRMTFNAELQEQLATVTKQRDEAEDDKLETYQRLCESRAKHKAALEQRDELVAALRHILNAPQDPDAVDQAFAALAKVGADNGAT